MLDSTERYRPFHVWTNHVWTKYFHIFMGILASLAIGAPTYAQNGILPKPAVCQNPPGFTDFDFQEPSNLTGSGVGRTWTYESALNYLGEDVDIRATLISLTSIGGTPTFPTSTPDLESIANSGSSARTVMWGFGQNTQGATTEAELRWEFLKQDGTPINISTEFEFTDIDGPDSDGTGRIETLLINRADYDGHSLTSDTTINATSDGVTDQFDGTIEASGLDSMVVKFVILNRSSFTWRQRITNFGTGSSGRAGFAINGPPFVVDDCPRYDFSDSAAYSDAQHNAFPVLTIGPTVDAEFTANTDSNALADGPDEDGVVIPAMTQGGAINIDVTVNEPSTNTAYLQGWIDFDGNGTFDTDEKVAADLQDSDGDNTISVPVNVPGNAITTQTFARFRWSTTAGLDATTLASDGEVEDYAVTIAQLIDPRDTLSPFVCTGDLYQAYTTSGQLARVNLATGGFDPIGSGSGGSLGPVGYRPSDNLVYAMRRPPTGGNFDTLVAVDSSGVVAELGPVSGLPAGAYNAGDVDGNGYLLARKAGSATGPIYKIDVDTQTVVGSINVTTSTSVADMAYNPVLNQIISVPTGTTELIAINPDTGAVQTLANITGPAVGDTGFGAMFSDANGNFFGMSNSSGKVYQIDLNSGVSTIVGTGGTSASNDGFSCSQGVFSPGLDYSDAPIAYGDASHMIDVDIRLGALNDADPGSLAGATATGDGSDDDGITIPALTQGETTTITADVSGIGGYLQGWIDFDGNGTFDAGEQVATDLQDLDGDGQVSISVNVPTSATTTQTFARFRWSTIQGLDAITNAPNGEAEDYAVTIAEGAPTLTLTKVADDTTDRAVGETVTYTYTVENTGNVNIDNVTIDDQHTSATGTSTLPVSGETGDAGNSAGSSDATANDGSWDVLAPGDSVTFTSNYLVTEADIFAQMDITNIATATATPASGTLTDPTANETVTVAPPAGPTFTPANPTQSCSWNWYRWQVTDGNPPSTNPEDDPVGILNPDFYVFNKVATNAGADTWYTSPFAPTDFELAVADNVSPTEQVSATDSERFYGVGYFRMPPNTTQTITLTDSGRNEAHAFAAFDSSGNLLSRFPSVSDVTTSGISYLASPNGAFSGAYPGLDGQADVRGGSWNDTFDIPVPADGNVYLHYIIADENQRMQNTTTDACIIEPALTLTKVADDDTDRAVGETINYTYTVENTGSIVVNNVTVSDQHTSAAGTNALPVAGETGDAGNSAGSSDATANDGSWDVLAPGDSVTFTSNYDITGADALTVSNITNIATATGTPASGTLTDPSANESVSLVSLAAADSSLTPFTCSNNFYEVISGQLAVLDPITGVYNGIGVSTPGYNATGYNINDNYVYGFLNSNANLIRVGADGSYEELYQPAGAGPGFEAQGVMIGDVLYYDSGTDIDYVNVATGDAGTLTFTGPNPGNVVDYAHVNSGGTDYLISVRNGSLYQYNLSTLTINEVTGVPGLPTDTGGQGAYGAAWATSDGLVYFSQNGTGTIFIIEGAATATPVVIGSIPAASTSSHDGMNCFTGGNPFDNIPELTVSKTASTFPSPVAAGDTITYTFEVENTGPITIDEVVPLEAGITVDGAAGTGTLSAITIVTETGFISTDSNTNGRVDSLAAGEKAKFEATYTLSQADIDAMYAATDPVTAVDNSATATGVPAIGSLATVTPSVVETGISPAPSLSMTKVADDDTLRAVGDVITYTYTVTNDGNVAVNDVAVTDSHNGSDPAPTPTGETLLTDAAPTGDSTDATANDGNWDVLAPGDSVTFTGTYTVTADDAANL